MYNIHRVLVSCIESKTAEITQHSEKPRAAHHHISMHPEPNLQVTSLQQCYYYQGYHSAFDALGTCAICKISNVSVPSGMQRNRWLLLPWRPLRHMPIWEDRCKQVRTLCNKSLMSSWWIHGLYHDDDVQFFKIAENVSHYEVQHKQCLPRQQWSLLNHFLTEQGHCGACRRKWRLTDTDLCPCSETQTMSHGKPGRSRIRSGSGKNPTAWTEMEGRIAYRQPMTIFWSRAQHHVTTKLMKLAVGEQNVATNLGIIFRLCWRILF